MSLADELNPNKRYDRVEAALKKLGKEDREAWLGALDSGDYSLPSLAHLLSKYSGEEVTPSRVSYYKKKVGL